MPDSIERRASFREINLGFNATFVPDRLSIGLVVPIETYATGPVPTMANHVERVRLVEELGFAAVWLRDVPMNVPSFGDAGQTFDPFVYLGTLAARTSSIALGVASIILPLRHPAHVAKAAASADQLSDGRLILGVASGDRPEEFPALGRSFQGRGDAFRESYAYIRRMSEDGPRFDNGFGSLPGGIDMLPKPVSGDLPLLITGGSQQSPEWIARNGDGWMTYPRPAYHQARLISEYRAQSSEAGQGAKPVMEPLYIDLLKDPNAEPRPIHIGLRLGADALRQYLATRRSIGVNHVALNLRFNQSNVEDTLRILADEILPDFHQ